MRRERVRNWMGVLGLAALIYGVGNLYQPTVVVGESMAPTLTNGRVIWIDRTYYRTHSPRCGDVVVFRQDDVTYVKRVYRGPGEKVRYISNDGQFLLPVRDPFFNALKAKYERGRSSLRLTEMSVPDDSVFVLGDNFSASVDSRQLGAIPISSILGRAHLDASPTRSLTIEFVPQPGRRYARESNRMSPGVSPDAFSAPGAEVGPVHPTQSVKTQSGLMAPPNFAPYRISQR